MQMLKKPYLTHFNNLFVLLASRTHIDAYTFTIPVTFTRVCTYACC